MVRRRSLTPLLSALLSATLAWCSVATAERAVAWTAGSAGFAAEAAEAVLSPAPRSELRLGRNKGTRSADGPAGGWPVAVGTDVPPLAPPAVERLQRSDARASRTDFHRSSPRSSRGPPA